MIQTPSTPVGSRLTWRELREKIEREDEDRRLRSLCHLSYMAYSEQEAEREGRRMFGRHN